MGVPDRLSKFLDGIRNEVTGVGTSRSKLSFGSYSVEPLLPHGVLEGLFKDNDLARKIVAKPVDDALRAGFSLRRRGADPSEDAEGAHTLCKAYQKLMTDRLGGDKLKRAAIAARLHGGGGLLLGAFGSGGLARPLDEAKTTEISYVRDWDRKSMTAVEWYPDGQPSLFRFQQMGLRQSRPEVLVHESRLLFFPGAFTTNEARTDNEDWDHSVLQPVFTTLKSFDQMFASVDAMFVDASQAVFKLQGLIKGLAEQDGKAEQDAKTRLAVMDMLRSATRAIVLEAGTGDGDPEEKFEVVERQTLGTLDKVIQQYYIRLASAANMPLTVLLGMSPSGMDATGELDLVFYFNTVDVYRQEALTPRISKIIRLLAQTELGETPEQAGEWEVVWPELSRPKPLDVATAENMAVTSLVQLITSQVVLPEEAALSLAAVAPGLRLPLAAEPRKKALEALYESLAAGELGEEIPGASPSAKQSERKTPSKAAKRQV